MLCLSGFQLYSRWVPLVRTSMQRFLRFERLKLIMIHIAYLPELFFPSSNGVFNEPQFAQLIIEQL